MSNFNYPPHAIQTYTGLVFDLNHITQGSISIIDIAHALSMQVRWGGHLPQFYSVAEHSMRVASIVPPRYKLAALLHDASEAYLGDLPGPFKKLMPTYQAYEKKIMVAVANKYGFEFPLPAEVKAADKEILHQEWDHVKRYRVGPSIKQRWVFEDFMKKFEEYSKIRI